MSEQASFDIKQVIDQARAVITSPVAYFQSMPKSRGYANPIIFIAVMGAHAVPRRSCSGFSPFS
jgi:hypothetical protein